MFAPYRELEDFNIHIPNKFFDAMANSKPIITSISGVARKLVSDNEIGLVYQSAEPDSLRNELLKILNEKYKLAQMGNRARELYENEYSLSKVYGNAVSHLVFLAKPLNDSPTRSEGLQE